MHDSDITTCNELSKLKTPKPSSQFNTSSTSSACMSHLKISKHYERF